MSRQLDRRPVRGATLLTHERESALAAAAEEASRALPGAQRVTIAEINPTTGNPAVVALEEGPAAEGNFVQRALEHVQAIGGALGFAPEQADRVRGRPGRAAGAERREHRASPAAVQGDPGLRRRPGGSLPPDGSDRPRRSGST